MYIIVFFPHDQSKGLFNLPMKNNGVSYMYYPFGLVYPTVYILLEVHISDKLTSKLAVFHRFPNQSSSSYILVVSTTFLPKKLSIK